MIGKIVSTVAGRSLWRSVHRIASLPKGGPTGALLGRAMPLALPRIVRHASAGGMLAAAMGGVLVNRWLDYRRQHKDADGLESDNSAGRPEEPAAPSSGG